MYVWFVVLLGLGSLTAGYFFSIGFKLGGMSFDAVEGWYWRRLYEKAERKYFPDLDECLEKRELDIEFEPSNGDQETTHMEPVE